MNRKALFSLIPFCLSSFSLLFSCGEKENSDISVKKSEHLEKEPLDALLFVEENTRKRRKVNIDDHLQREESLLDRSFDIHRSYTLFQYQGKECLKRTIGNEWIYYYDFFRYQGSYESLRSTGFILDSQGKRIPQSTIHARISDWQEELKSAQITRQETEKGYLYSIEMKEIYPSMDYALLCMSGNEGETLYSFLGGLTMSVLVGDDKIISETFHYKYEIPYNNLAYKIINTLSFTYPEDVEILPDYIKKGIEATEEELSIYQHKGTSLEKAEIEKNEEGIFNERRIDKNGVEYISLKNVSPNTPEFGNGNIYMKRIDFEKDSIAFYSLDTGERIRELFFKEKINRFSFSEDKILVCPLGKYIYFLPIQVFSFDGGDPLFYIPAINVSQMFFIHDRLFFATTIHQEKKEFTRLEMMDFKTGKREIILDLETSSSIFHYYDANEDLLFLAYNCDPVRFRLHYLGYDFSTMNKRYDYKTDKFTYNDFFDSSSQREAGISFGNNPNVINIATGEITESPKKQYTPKTVWEGYEVNSCTKAFSHYYRVTLTGNNTKFLIYDSEQEKVVVELPEPSMRLLLKDGYIYALSNSLLMKIPVS